MPTYPLTLPLAVSLVLATASAQAAVDLTVLGAHYTHPDVLSISTSGTSPGGTSGTLGATGNRTNQNLASSVAGDTSGFFTWGVLGSESVVSSTYEPLASRRGRWWISRGCSAAAGSRRWTTPR